MSAPTRQLGKLSLETQMLMTTRQAHVRSSGNLPEDENTSSSSDEVSSDCEEAAASALSRPRTQISQSKGKQPARAESPTSSTEMSPSPMMSRAYKTRDILSTFDPEKLPKEFRPDIFERISHPRTPAECLRPSDLEGTIFQLAVNDHAVYQSLSKAQPVQARAVNVFQKVAKQIRISFVAFDDYAQHGTLSRVIPGPHHSIKDLGSRLEDLVKVIRAEERERDPYGGERAAECLLYLLREVCNRNYDAFENNTWRRRALRGEDEDDRNLFQCLIGHAPIGGPPFVLDALKVLPQAVLANSDKQEQLEEIRGLLYRHQAPVAYRRAFQGILDSATATIGRNAGPQPGQKRPAAGTGQGGHKRTK